MTQWGGPTVLALFAGFGLIETYQVATVATLHEGDKTLRQ